jgi:SAM-dependent methyltransferase
VNDPKRETRALADTYAERGDPNGWFEEFYARAGGDIRKVYWADLAPNPELTAWLRAHEARPGDRATTIGCGLGDDAEELARFGYDVTAFDISPSAVAMCRKRYLDSAVAYVVADLFDHPPAWRRAFDVVYECNTVQILVGADRTRAIVAIADLVAPGGALLVSCRSRETGEGLEEFPLALDREEIDGFRRAGLVEVALRAYDDDQDPPVPHFFAVYRRDG